MHKPVSDVTREWGDWWAFAAVVAAMIGVAAGYAFVNARFDAPAAAENYLALRARGEYLRGAAALVSILAPLVSIVLGLISRAKSSAVAGLLAAAFTVVWVPSNLRACCGSDEASVIGILRTINSAQQAYTSVCAQNKGFANSVEALTTPPVPDSPPFLTPAFSGVWAGYRVTMHIPEGSEIDFVACDGRRVVSAYFVEAHPIEPNVGRRNFATDEQGTIYQTSDGTIIQPGMAGAEVIQ